MKTKYEEAFDSLSSDESKKQARLQRILKQEEAKPVRRGLGRKGKIALGASLGVVVLASSIAALVAIGVANNLENKIARLQGTYVDMEGVTAFGVWNPPDESGKANIRSLARLPKKGLYDETGEGRSESEYETVSWDTEDPYYDWQKDYDWDPTKANVLIAMNEDGSIDEVVYERINSRGQVRQDSLGNVASVFVSENFTYVMYVNDSEWQFWKDINFAQEVRYFNGFHCHHEEMQTIVIHNETGRVYALKDIFPSLNEVTGVMNYVLQAHPTKNDILHVLPVNSNHPAWFDVLYEEERGVYYEPILTPNSDYGWNKHIVGVRKDQYGQIYALESDVNEFGIGKRTGPGIVNLTETERYDNLLLFKHQSELLYGSDKRMYAFVDGKLEVYGESYTLSPVEEGLSVSFKGVSLDYVETATNPNSGIAYRLEDGYLYSMFGEVWQVGKDGIIEAKDPLEGSFPRYGNDAYVVGGEMLAIVDTHDVYDFSMDGRLVQLDFGLIDGVPSVKEVFSMKASEIYYTGYRLMATQDELENMGRGFTKYFYITVKDGKVNADYVAYGNNGGMLGLTKPITEPLDLS